MGNRVRPRVAPPVRNGRSLNDSLPLGVFSSEMIRKIVAFAVLLLAACSNVDLIENAGSDESTETRSASTTSASPTTSHSSSPTTTSTWPLGPVTQSLRRVDPGTLAVLDDVDGPHLRPWFSYTVDRNRRFLALLSGAESYRGGLQVFDADWNVLSGPVPADDPHGTLRLGSDGDAYWLESYWVDSPTGRTPFHLLHVPAGASQSQDVATLPEGFSPHALNWLSSDGDRFVALGFVSGGGLAGGSGMIVAIDTSSGRVDARDVDITIGIAPEADRSDPVFDRYDPGLVVDHDERLLYVVHADRDRLSVIDLENLETVSDQPITRPQSLIDRLVTWLVPPAQAKLSRGTSHTAVLGPDGTLYVASSVTEAEQTDGGWIEHSTPTGLRAIDPRTAVEMAQLDIPVDQVSISPGGLLVASGSSWTDSPDGAQSTMSGLYIIQTDPLELIQHLTPVEDSEWEWLVGISPDRDVAYVQVASGDSGEKTLHAIDIRTGHITGSYTDPNPHLIPEFGLLAMPHS